MLNYYGYVLESVKMMETPRGISYTGDIYHSGDKIGTAFNGGDGGMTQVYSSAAAHDHGKILTEAFVERLFLLNDYETIFIEEMRDKPKKGLAFVTYQNPFDLEAILCNRNETMDSIVNRIMNARGGREVKTIEVFRSAEDFNIDKSHNPDLFTADSKLNINPASVLTKIRQSKQNTPQKNAAKKRTKSGPEL